MMLKRYCFILYILAHVACYGMDNALINCVQASRLAYKNQLSPINPQDFNPHSQHSLFNGFNLIHAQDLLEYGFHGVTFYNPHTETLITAFRGTDETLKANIQEDVGIMDTLSQFHKVPLDKLVTQQYTQASDYFYQNSIWGKIQKTSFSWLSPLLLKGTLRYEDSADATINEDRLRALIAAARAYYTIAHQRYQTIKHNNPDPQAQHYITGHSLGGFIAQILCMNKPNTQSYTFNAPGAMHMIPSGMTVINPIHNYIRAHDIIGTLGIHIGSQHSIEDISRKPYGPFDIIDYCENNHSIGLFAEDLEARYAES